jgi:hypothetical protein
MRYPTALREDISPIRSERAEVSMWLGCLFSIGIRSNSVTTGIKKQDILRRNVKSYAICPGEVLLSLERYSKIELIE